MLLLLLTSLMMSSSAVAMVTVVIAPSAPPQSVEGTAINTSAIDVHWRPPLNNHHNGRLAGYRVIYASSSSTEPRSSSADIYSDPTPNHHHHGVGGVNSWSSEAFAPRTVTVGPRQLSYIISGLSAWTTYRIWIVAFTLAGDGPASDVIVVQTDEGGRIIVILLVRVAFIIHM